MDVDIPEIMLLKYNTKGGMGNLMWVKDKAGKICIELRGTTPEVRMQSYVSGTAPLTHRLYVTL